MSTEWALAIVAIGVLGIVNAWATLRLHRALALRSPAGQPSSLYESILGAKDVMSDRRVSQAVRSNVPLLAVFVSEGCAHCHRIMPQLNVFAGEHVEDAAVVAVIAGSSTDARQLAETRGLVLPAVSGNEIGQAVPWTPYVYVCDSHGAIVNEGALSSRADLETFLHAALTGQAPRPAAATNTAARTGLHERHVRKPRLLRRQIAELERALPGRDFSHSTVVRVGGERTEHTIELGPAGPPIASITITGKCLHDIVDGKLCLSAALASAALTAQGQIGPVGQILEIVGAISSSAADAPQLPDTATQGVALFTAVHGLMELPSEIDDRASLGAAVLAAGTPLTRLFRIAQLNDAYMSSRVSAAEYHDLVRGLLELVAQIKVGTASRVPTIPAIEEFSHA